MALKTEKKPDASVAEPTPTTVLELALYKKYTWKGYTYEQGKPYRFRNEDAITLLGEQDLGRPIWKLYRAPVVKRAAVPEVVDATNVQAIMPVDEFGTPVDPTQKRIDVGSDDEIKDILDRQESDGDVTV